MATSQQRPELTGSQALNNTISRTPGCLIGVLTGALAGSFLGALGRATMAIAFLYWVAQSNGTFFPGNPTASLADVIQANAIWIAISATIGLIACGLAGATCRVLLAAPIGVLLSALPFLVLIAFPSTFLMSMSGGNTEPDVQAVWIALGGMAVIGGLAGAGGALAGRLTMKMEWGNSNAVTAEVGNTASGISAMPTNPRVATDPPAASDWFSRPDNLWLILCVAICSAVVIGTVVFFQGGIFIAGLACFAVLAVGFLIGPLIFFGVFLKNLSSVTIQNEKVTYEAFATAVDGRTYQGKAFGLFGHRPWAIEFLFRGLRVVIDSEYRRVGQHYFHYARISLKLPQFIQFHCDLSPHCMLDAVLRPNSQDVRLGWNVFDEEFRVRTNNESLVAQVLDTTIQQQLLRLKEFSKTIRSRLTDPGRVCFLIDGHMIQIRLLGVISKEEEMVEFYNLCAALFNHLLPRLVGQRHFSLLPGSK